MCCCGHSQAGTATWALCSLCAAHRTMMEFYGYLPYGKEGREENQPLIFIPGSCSLQIEQFNKEYIKLNQVGEQRTARKLLEGKRKDKRYKIKVC